MQKGDISNSIVPRMLIVFEGFLGQLNTPKDKAALAVAMRLHKWKSAVNCFELNGLVVQHIWDAVWRKNYTIDVVTFYGQGFGEALEIRLENEDLPVGSVHATTPGLLAREVVYRPNVLAVYDPDPSHVFTYGSKGRVVSADAPNLFGV